MEVPYLVVGMEVEAEEEPPSVAAVVVAEETPSVVVAEETPSVAVVVAEEEEVHCHSSLEVVEAVLLDPH